MNKQSKKSYVLIAYGFACFFLGGIGWFLFAMVYTKYEMFAVPVAAILAAAGALILIFNAIVHPESIPHPNIPCPEINLPSEIGGYHGQHVHHHVANAPTSDMISTVEWPILRMFRYDNKSLTAKQHIRGSISCLLWIATLAIYMLVSFHTNQWEITWVIFLGAAFFHTLIYALLK